MRTPWGDSDSTERTADPNVTFYSTPSHGGYRVKGAALKRIPEQFRTGHAGVPGWFEEDCDWAIVAYFLPELFSITERADAIDCLTRWNPKVLAA